MDLANRKGIEMAIKRHIKNMEEKGQVPTVENLTKRVTRGIGFKIVGSITGLTDIDVAMVARTTLRRHRQGGRVSKEVLEGDKPSPISRDNSSTPGDGNRH